MKKAIEIQGLSKSYGDIKAVDGLSFTVKEGELFAFIGVNGAGKSTTINIICGQLKKDAGSVIINGKNIDTSLEEIKGRLGVVFQTSLLDKALSVRSNLESRAALYGITGAAFEERLDYVCGLLDITELLRRTVGKLSGGQRRRIDIARALIHDPDILFLDEPTTGLDPQTRKLLWNVIDRLRKEHGLTVFLTTHYMEEAADADYVVIIESGKIAASGTPLELKNAYAKDFITVYGKTCEELDVLGAPCEEVRDGFRLTVESTKAATEMIIKHPSLFTDYEITKGKMDDVFLAVTGKKLTGGEDNA